VPAVVDVREVLRQLRRQCLHQGEEPPVGGDGAESLVELDESRLVRWTDWSKADPVLHCEARPCARALRDSSAVLRRACPRRASVPFDAPGAMVDATEDPRLSRQLSLAGDHLNGALLPRW
jgi:hypothetical protein